MQKFACRGQISAFLLSFCDTFHLNQPSWSADFGFYDDAGYLRIKLLHHSVYRMIVGNISQVDDEVLAPTFSSSLPVWRTMSPS